MRGARNVKENKIAESEFMYKKKMCSTCTFFIEEECIKHRIPEQCAKRGLKNKR